MDKTFTPFHRGGSGSPLLLLHGFTDTWRTWELVLPELEKHHDVLALTLAGHAGGPGIAEGISEEVVLDEIEMAMDEAGFGRAHIAGNSLGGYLSLKMAERDRAESVIALAPAGGWAEGDESFRDALEFFTAMRAQLEGVLPYVETIVSTPEGRRGATQFITVNYEHIPADLIAHQIVGAATAPGVIDLVATATDHGWTLDPEKITCPVRIVWGTEDRILAYPRAAARFRNEWLPNADWVELEGVGHCPQLDVPTETAQLILGFTAP